MVFNPFSAFGGNGAPPGEGAVVRPPAGAALRVGEPVDVIDRLPDEAKGHLSALRDHVEALYDAVERLNAKRKESWQERGEAELNYKKLTDPTVASRYSRMHIVKEDHPEATAAKGKIDKAASAARAAQDRYDAAAERWQKAKRLLINVEKFIAAAGSLTMAPALKVKLPTVDRLAAEVEKIRSDLAELQAEKHEVRSAAFPAAEVKARARAEIEALAARGRPGVLGMIDNGPGEGIFWPDVVAKSRPRGGMAVPLPGDAPRVSHDLAGGHLALMAWLHKDALLAAIEAEIDMNAEDESALSTEQRTVRLAEIDGRILDAERIECAIIRASGGALDFREGCDPRALLCLNGPPQGEDS